jgi:hypothetical protein
VNLSTYRTRWDGRHGHAPPRAAPVVARRTGSTVLSAELLGVQLGRACNDGCDEREDDGEVRDSLHDEAWFDEWEVFS